MLHRHTRNGQIYQHHSTPLQLDRVFYKEYCQELIIIRQNLFQDRQRHQHFKYVIGRQGMKTWLSMSYQVPSAGLIMIQTRRRMTVWVIMFSFHPCQFFHVFAVLLLIKPVPCYVPASILKG